MKQKVDWMPFNHEALYYKAAQTAAYLTPVVLTRIGIAGSAHTWYQNEFISKYNKFKAAFENWQNPAERTPTKSTILFAAEKDFKKAYRQLILCIGWFCIKKKIMIFFLRLSVFLSSLFYICGEKSNRGIFSVLRAVAWVALKY